MQTDYSLLSELGPSERLLWSGKPRGGIRFRQGDAVLIPFSLLWGGFAVFWEASVVGSGAPIFFTLWGVPFVLVGLYMTCGRFITDKLRRDRTTYALTNERIIIRAGLFNRMTKSLNLETLSDVTLDERSDHSGTITFGPAFPFSRLYTRQSFGNTPTVPAFEMIDDAKVVYDRIRVAQHDARRKDD